MQSSSRAPRRISVPARLAFPLVLPLAVALLAATGFSTAAGQSASPGDDAELDLIHTTIHELELVNAGEPPIVETTPPRPGGLHIWVLSSDFDPVVRVVDADGEVIDEDEDSGGDGVPFLMHVVSSDAPVRIEVASQEPGGTGSAVLHIVHYYELAEVVQGMTARQTQVLGIMMKHRAGDSMGARALARTAFDDVLSIPGARSSLTISNYLHELASVAFNIGAFELAAEAVRIALACNERVLPPSHTKLVRAKGQAASLLAQVGDPIVGRALLEEAHTILERNCDPDDKNLQLVRSNLASVLTALGDYANARVLQEKAVEVLSRTRKDDDAALLRARRGLASTLWTLEELDAARELSEKVLEVAERTMRPENVQLHSIWQSYAALLMEFEEWDRSLVYWRKVMDARRKALGDDHPYYQTVADTSGMALCEKGELEEGVRIMEAALDCYARKLPGNHPYLLGNLNRYARYLAQLGRTEDSIATAMRLAEIVRGEMRRGILRVSPREAEGMARELTEEVSVIATLASGAGPVPSTPELRREAFSVIEASRSAALTSRRMAARLASTNAVPEARSLRGQANAAAGQLVALAVRQGSVDQIAAKTRELEGIERRLRELLGSQVDAAGSDSTALLPDVDPTAVGATLEPHDRAIGYWRYTRTDIDDENPREYEDVESMLAYVLHPDGRVDLVNLGPVDAIEQAIVAWREAIGVEGTIEGTGSARAGSTQARSAQAGAASGSDDDRGVRVATLPASKDAVHAAGVALRERVLDPIAQSLAGSRRWIVALDDAMHLVPLDALPAAGSKAGEAYLGDRHEIWFRPTLCEMTLEVTAPDGPHRVLALGGVDYDAAPVRMADLDERLASARGAQTATAGSATLRSSAWNEDFSYLPGTLAEIAEIDRLTARQRASTSAKPGDGSLEVTLLTKAAASKPSFVEMAPRFRYLHLATHGYFLPESIPTGRDDREIDAISGLGRFLARRDYVATLTPMTLCGLALAGANRGEANSDEAAHETSSGTITAEEIGYLDLSGCELAVLSACDTNVGIRRAGQGVDSLLTAFHAAGAQSVVCSLWRIEDRTAVKLTPELYRAIGAPRDAGSPPPSLAAALWEAKTKLRTEGVPVREWSAWMLSGEHRRPN